MRFVVLVSAICTLTCFGCGIAERPSSITGAFFLQAPNQNSKQLNIFEKTSLTVTVTKGDKGNQDTLIPIDLSLWFEHKNPKSFGYEIQKVGFPLDSKDIMDVERRAHYVQRLELKPGESTTRQIELPSIIFEDFYFHFGLVEDHFEVPITGGAPGVVVTSLISFIMGEQDKILYDGTHKIDVTLNDPFQSTYDLSDGGKIVFSAKRYGSKNYTKEELKILVAEGNGYRKSLLSHRDPFDTDDLVNLQWNQFVSLMEYEMYGRALEAFP